MITPRKTTHTSTQPTVISTLRILVISTLLVALTLFVSACAAATPPSQSTFEPTTDALAFSAQTTQGDTYDITQDEKPVVLYFMASWCPSCAKNWENVNKIYPQYQDDITFIAVSIDPTDTDDILTSLAQRQGFTFDSISGDQGIATLYNIRGQTHILAFNTNKQEVYNSRGVLTTTEWEQLFERLKTA